MYMYTYLYIVPMVVCTVVDIEYLCLGPFFFPMGSTTLHRAAPSILPNWTTPSSKLLFTIGHISLLINVKKKYRIIYVYILQKKKL